jgi:CPA2 family monovalent cation:H+ antiporter-2
VRELRKQGVVALLGSADNPVLLERVGLDRARVVVVTIPDPLVVRQVLEYVRRHYSGVEVLVRTHSIQQMHDLRRRGAREAAVGELEVALELTRHTLRRFGVSATETLAAVQGLRSRAGASEREHE